MGKRKTQLSDYSDEDSALTKKRTPKKNNERKITKDSDLEEGEVSDSDSVDSSEEEFNDGYHSDLMGDEEDRLCLAQMTEKEREQEIFRRVEARETMRTRFNIEKKLRKEQRRALKKQRLLLEEKIESPSTSSTRDRFLEKKKSSEENVGRSVKKLPFNSSKMRYENVQEFDEIENRSKGDKSPGVTKDLIGHDTVKTSRTRKTKLKASDVYSDDSDSSSDGQIMMKSRLKKKTVSSSSSSSSSSESDSDSHVLKSKAKIQYISTRAQLNQMKLSRHKLERFVHLPFFKRVAVGCFVKVTIASNNGRPVYRICEITDIGETQEPYRLGNTQTTKTLKLKHGTLEGNFRLEFVSNANFLDENFIKWRDTCTLHGVKMPTVDQMESKMKDIKEAMLFELSLDEIEKIINEKERFKNSRYEFAMKRTLLEKEYESARAADDTVRAGELQDELNEVEERAAKLNEFRASTINSINYINDRNRKKHFQEEDASTKEKVKSADDTKSEKSLAEHEEFVVDDGVIVSAVSSDGTNKENDSPVTRTNFQKEDYSFPRSTYRNVS